MKPDPLSVICPLCGALPGEPCMMDAPGSATLDGSARIPHSFRHGEAARVLVLRAEPTKAL